jgi:hypothetical protein
MTDQAIDRVFYVLTALTAAFAVALAVSLWFADP